MRKKSLFIILFVSMFIILISSLTIYAFRDKEIPLDNSKFTLIDDMKVEVYSKSIISSKISSIDGNILEDKEIDTSVLGKQTIEFLYEDLDGKKKKGNIEIEVVDTTLPIILMSNSYNVTVGYSKDLTDVILSADNYDSNPTREIVGDYDINQVGSYNVSYKVTDSSGNVASQDFILNVKAKSSGSSSSSILSYTYFSDIVALHKNDNTKIGIDVSKWQGEIDFEKLKNAGVEFMLIRVGTQLGFNEDSIIDKYFKRNIEGAQSVGIPVGIYYYSYATSDEEAKEQASWVVEQLKGYNIDLPIIFDWESWSYFNGLSLSLHGINSLADTFLSEVEAAGYKGMLYGSKYYLQNIWDSNYPIWLAHYTTKTNYEGSYDIWQLCQNGRVAGINGNVDIDVMYE